MAKLSKFVRDETAVEEGIWVDWEEGIRLRIRPVGNRDYQQFMLRNDPDAKKRLTPAQMRRRERDLVNEWNKREPLAREAAARFLLVDWANVEDDEGRTVPYSPEAVDFFRGTGLDELYEYVMSIARDETSFRREREADDVEVEAGN